MVEWPRTLSIRKQLLRLGHVLFVGLTTILSAVLLALLPQPCGHLLVLQWLGWCGGGEIPIAVMVVVVAVVVAVAVGMVTAVVMAMVVVVAMGTIVVAWPAASSPSFSTRPGAASTPRQRADTDSPPLSQAP